MLLRLMQSTQAAGAGQNVPSATDSQGGALGSQQTGAADAGGSQTPPAPAPGGAAASQFAVQTLASLLNYQQTQPTSSNAASQLIGQLDTNGDGQLSLAEIEKALGAATSDQINGLTQAFNQVDANGDGQISQSELAAAITKAQQDGSASSMAGLHGHHHPHHGGGAFGLARNIIDQLDDTFIVSNGDLLTSMDLSAMARQHIETGCDASIGVFERENKIDFGLIEFDAENRLSAYREKPSSMYFVSMGIYILRREAVRPRLVQGEYLDMPSLLLKMRDANADVRCYHDGGMWLDIGRPDDFALAQSLFEQDRSLFLGS